MFKGKRPWKEVVPEAMKEATILVIGLVIFLSGVLAPWVVMSLVPEEWIPSLPWDEEPDPGNDISYPSIIRCGDLNATVGDNLTIGERYQLHGRKIGSNGTNIIVSPTNGSVNWTFNLAGVYTLREPLNWDTWADRCVYTITVMGKVEG